MKEEMLKHMYMQYVSMMKRTRTEHIDIPTEQITKKKSKKK